MYLLILLCIIYIVCRSWCPDRTLAQARKFISDSMGERYAEGVILDLVATWQESDPRTPLICFLSMGSDPTSNIENLAKKLKLECHAISMGQGQEIHARRLLNQCSTSVSTCTCTCIMNIYMFTCTSMYNIFLHLTIIYMYSVIGWMGIITELSSWVGLFGRTT